MSLKIPQAFCSLVSVVAIVAFLSQVAVSQPHHHPADPHDNHAANQPPQNHANQPEAGPNGTTKVGNKTCPMMNNKPVHATKGFAYNGWWISICCSMCEKKFRADTAKFAALIKKAADVDVTQLAPREAGPDGTLKLGNTKCAVTDDEVVNGKGFAYNGWWIGVCCPDCEKGFAKDSAKYVAKLLEQTGIDVSKQAPKPEHHQDNKHDDHGHGH